MELWACKWSWMLRWRKLTVLKELYDTVTCNCNYTHDNQHYMIIYMSTHYSKGHTHHTQKSHIFISELKLYPAESTSAVRHRSLTKGLLLAPSTQKLLMSYVIKLALLGEVPQHQLTVLAVWMHPALQIQQSVLMRYH
jgi:hypothetical protein